MQISVEGYPKRNTNLHSMSRGNGKWQWLIFSMRHLVEMSGEVAVYAYRNASNLRSQDVSKEILSDLERKDVAEQ